VRRAIVVIVLLLLSAVPLRADDALFRNQVQPILAKFGCSTGACHGAAAGKNGFKLSLRGYDDEGDWRAITKQAQGRRITPSDPGASLLLLKATNAVSHKGGKRFEVDSREYKVLAEWIAQGAPGPGEKDARIERLEVLPGKAVLKPGDKHTLTVRAHFSDGSSQDVTPWVKYTSNDTTVGSVDDTGIVTITGYGEGAITAWYLSKIATATVTSPYPHQLNPDIFTQSPRGNFIDDLVVAKLRELNLKPSGPSSDGEFIRRAYLDTIGVLPTPAEMRTLLADGSAQRRDKIIESLLARPEYVDYWTYKWSDLLLVNSSKLRPPAAWAYSQWLRKHVAANTPWDKMVRELATATGSTLENGAANFFVLHDDPTEMAENITVAFMGMSVNCAKCHNHPMEKWTNDQYYGLANLFSRVRQKAPANAGEGNVIIFSAAEGELNQPLTGKPQPPRPLDGKAVPFEATGDRREQAADWLVSPENPYFARAIVNRVWANFMGVGLVEKVDDMRKTNPASNEALLTALADHLVKNQFDLKALMRAILQSQAYQRSSKPLPENAGDQRFYSRYYPKRLMAEVMLDALSQATAAPTAFKDYPAGWRALQLPDAGIDSYFLKAFGRPERLLTCECERTSEPSMAQVLHIANGDTLNEKLRAKGNRIDQLIAGKATNETIIEEAYLAGVSRLPTESEMKAMLATLNEAKESEKREVIEDLFWSVLSSKEFLFNH
jgi:hypothetical protein